MVITVRSGIGTVFRKQTLRLFFCNGPERDRLPNEIFIHPGALFLQHRSENSHRDLRLTALKFCNPALHDSALNERIRPMAEKQMRLIISGTEANPFKQTERRRFVPVDHASKPLLENGNPIE